MYLVGCAGKPHKFDSNRPQSPFTGSGIELQQFVWVHHFKLIGKSTSVEWNWEGLPLLGDTHLQC